MITKEETPAYYNSMNIQPIQVMQQILSPEQFQGFLIGNLTKYVLRYGEKEPEEVTAKKLKVYSTWLDESLRGEPLSGLKGGEEE